jgi:hypothetical protein
MPRYKFIERDFLHIVEMVVPERGLRGKRDAMHDFHTRHSIPVHSRDGRYKDGCRYVRWYFADRDIAEAFAKKFAKEKDSIPLQRPQQRENTRKRLSAHR